MASEAYAVTRDPGSALLDALATALAILGPHGEIEYLNAAAQTLLAVGINQARGRPIAEFLREPAANSGSCRSHAPTASSWSTARRR